MFKHVTNKGRSEGSESGSEVEDEEREPESFFPDEQGEEEGLDVGDEEDEEEEDELDDDEDAEDATMQDENQNREEQFADGQDDETLPEDLPSLEEAKTKPIFTLSTAANGRKTVRSARYSRRFHV